MRLYILLPAATLLNTKVVSPKPSPKPKSGKKTKYYLRCSRTPLIRPYGVGVRMYAFSRRVGPTWAWVMSK